ncbi:MAG: SurA N-terminal domain-containing protein [Deltaproteobacteria bacterium]|nr:SurA N-terminal domain-containing protein [Deltaproteobacteria bacterium]
MLKVLRKRKRSWIIYLILGAIILVFVLWGVGSFKVDKSTIAARVNGKPITAIDYARAYQQQMNYYRNIFKDQFSDELLEKLNLKQNTIQMLINTELQLQEAKRQGIAVSTDDIQKRIASIQTFQKDGAFDKGQYLQVLKANHILPGDYEKGVKESLIIDKLQKKTTDAINISDKETEETFTGESRKINLQYLAVDAAKFEKGTIVTNEEAKTYFEKNRASFKAAKYEDAADAVKAAVVKEKTKEKAKETADAVLKRLKQGEDFQKVASKDGYAKGESGFITKVQGYIASIGLNIGDKPEAFSLNKENPYYSQVVPHGNKFYILKMKEVKEADKAEFEAKKAEIKNRLLQQKQQEALNKWIDEIKSKAKIEINKEAM